MQYFYSIFVARKGQQPTRNPSKREGAAEKYPKDKNKITREKANTMFNEVRQYAYVLGVREKKILLIK